MRQINLKYFVRMPTQKKKPKHISRFNTLNSHDSKNKTPTRRYVINNENDVNHRNKMNEARS